MYDDDSLLKLSGIQHFAFCRRQWALIHVEQQWAENSRTIEGKHLHTRVDNPNEREKRRNTITIRSVELLSRSLGLYGVADIVEYRSVEEDGIVLHNYEGLWKPFPVEYKRGQPKTDNRDEVQLCAQAICLEEMHGITLTEGALYYGETNRRIAVNFDIKLRLEVDRMALLMHEIFETGLTPLPEYKSHCKACSLINLCLPKEIDCRSAKEYLNKELGI